MALKWVQSPEAPFEDVASPKSGFVYVLKTKQERGEMKKVSKQKAVI